jgi:hypothetical protein
VVGVEHDEVVAAQHVERVEQLTEGGAGGGDLGVVQRPDVGLAPVGELVVLGPLRDLLMAIAILTVWTVSSTFLWAFSRFIALVGAMIAGFGLFDYLGRGQYRSRITELESKRTVLKKRMSEAWSSFS